MRRAPRRRASSACPMALLILCAPVCARSSRLIHTCAPQRADRRAAKVSAVGRPTQLRQLRGEFRLEVAARAGARARRARAARAPGSASPARSARRTGRSARAHRESAPPADPRAGSRRRKIPTLMANLLWQCTAAAAAARAALTKAAMRRGTLHPGPLLDATRHVDAERRDRGDRGGDVAGVQAAGEDHLRAARERARRLPVARRAAAARGTFEQHAPRQRRGAPPAPGAAPAAARAPAAGAAR